MKGKLRVFRDPMALAQHVAGWLTSAAIASNRPFRISVSGGSTPQTLYALLASDEWVSRFPWHLVSWYWGDECFVPPDHPESNFRMVWDTMFAKVPAPLESVHPVPINATPDESAQSYQQVLQEAYGAETLDPKRPFFDVMLLGLGADGHTASLLPGEPVLQERKSWVAAVPHGQSRPRITMTYPMIESSRRVAFLVTGSKKACILSAIRSGRSKAPAARVSPVGELLWFVDRAAAGIS